MSARTALSDSGLLLWALLLSRRALRAALQDEAVVMKEDYLGLRMPGDASLPPNYLRRLAELVEEHVDLTALLQVC